MKCDSLLEKELNVNKSILIFLRQAFDLIATYTVIPKQIIGILGGLLCLMGIFLFLIYYRIFVGSPSSLTSFIAIIILLSGLMLLATGVISEYLVKVYAEIKRMPLYIIKRSNIPDIINEKN
tara:strand:- start:203 stop:568 length:366 start_codon:yes stop_codon:yes gene_type:complete